jgi:hypothetical protein
VRLVAVVIDHPPVRLGVLAGEIEIGEDFDDQRRDELGSSAGHDRHDQRGPKRLLQFASWSNEPARSRC